MRVSHRMYGTFTVAVALLLIAPISTAQAKANCWCEMQCSADDGESFSVNNNWPKRPKGKNFNFPFSSNEWNECKSYCSSHVLGVNLEAEAKSRNICGAVQCSSRHKLGTRKWRDSETRNVNTVCEPPPPPPSENFSQYSTKLVCGRELEDQLVERGHYLTTVNVHNPNEESIAFRRKVAIANRAKDGAISNFEYGDIGPDGAQYFDCGYINEQSGTSASDLTDGFFVIESEDELDVTAIYTNRQLQSAGNPAVGAPSLDIERTKARDILKPKNWCTRNFRVDLSNPANWTVVSDNTPLGPVTIVSDPSWKAEAWDDDRTWMSVSRDGEPPTDDSVYMYALSFCSCANSSSAIISGNAKVDNSLTAEYLNPGSTTASSMTLSASNNFTGGNDPVTFTQAFAAGVGTGGVSMRVVNGNGPTGLSVTGVLTVPYGRPGSCPN